MIGNTFSLDYIDFYISKSFERKVKVAIGLYKGINPLIV